MAVNVENLILQAKRDGRGQEIDFVKTAPTAASGGHYSLWQSAGNPGAGSYSGSKTATQLLRTTQGALAPLSNAGGGKRLFANACAARTSNAAGTLTIWDALLYYAGIDHTTNAAQALTNVATLPRYTTGAGLQAFLEVTSALGATAQNVTLGYTNQAGTAGRASVAQAIQASSVVGRLCHGLLSLPLQAGDTGLRSVETATFSAANTGGTSALVIAKRLLSLPVALANVDGEFDALLRRSLPQIVDDACLFVTFSAGATATTPSVTGWLDLVSLDQ